VSEMLSKKALENLELIKSNNTDDGPLKEDVLG